MKAKQTRLLLVLTACLSAPLFATAASSPVNRITVNQGAIKIEAYEQGTGKTIVILPSLGRGAQDYDDVAGYLAQEGFRVLRPEPRGVNGSQGPLNNLTLHDFAADVALLMDHENTGPAVVVGHAWGSQPARVLAVDRPDLVKGVVMAAASVGKFPPGYSEKPYGRMVEAITGSGNYALPEAQRLKYLQQAFFAPGNDPHPWLTGWYEATHKAEAQARDATPVDLYWSAGSSVPILDLQGSNDAVVIPNILKSMLGDRVEARTLAGAGHAMAPERPREMAQAIAEFAKRVYADTAVPGQVKGG
ncbi:alpha/beta fold hydrolase [Pseudomonas sp. MWU13-2105]|uniref:alpha/beta fold hydrolase n=1 Tax=Pseudomonas sp. MWU13-2105 TaxID=2935074 RepID=UPI00200DF6AB|nr:alpha/beta hydrolase [Pseudomonas sp. MWU13-2105]